MKVLEQYLTALLQHPIVVRNSPLLVLNGSLNKTAILAAPQKCNHTFYWNHQCLTSTDW